MMDGVFQGHGVEYDQDSHRMGGIVLYRKRGSAGAEKELSPVFLSAFLRQNIV
jgi:hypothetical protein